MKFIESFIPMDRRQAMAKQVPIPNRLVGAVLFVDIYGFTNIMGTYIQDLGKQRGTEELSRQLDAFFDTIIKQLYNYQGSVISFSGDAITCWFDGDDGHKAMTTAVKILEVIQPFAKLTTSVGSPVSIELKISIDAGPVNRFLVGDPKIMLFDIMAGKIVDEVSLGEKLAKKRDIVLSEQVFENCKKYISVKEWRKNDLNQSFAILDKLNQKVERSPWQPHPNLPIKITQSWLLPPILKRVREGQTAFLTELRLGIACFVKFSLDHSVSDDFDKKQLDNFIQSVQHQAKKYEGHIIQIIFGDKGNIIFLGFGAPISHEDDIDRALNTAQQIHDLPKKLSFIKDIQIGISQGQLRVGYYGGANRCTYTLLGEHTNLAARLMSTAMPGQTLVSLAIQQGARQFSFSPLGAMNIKGFVKPLPIFIINQKLPFVQEEKPLANIQTINRTKEKELLESVILDLKRKPSGHCLFLESEIGIGKTNFIQFIEKEVRKNNFKVFVGRAESIEQSVPFHPFIPILTKIFDIDYINESEPELKGKINLRLAKIDKDLPQWASLLNLILPFTWKETQAITALSSGERGQKIKWLLKLIFQDLVKLNKLVLIFENAQWLDASTWNLIPELLEEIPSLFLAIPLRRNNKINIEKYIELKADVKSRTLEMELLDKDSTYQLVCNQYACKEINTDIFNLVYQKTNGNPLFSFEFFNTLLNDGTLIIEDEKMKLVKKDALMTINLPENVQGVITNRIDILESRQQLVLKVASVIGVSFLVHYVQIIYPVEEDKSKINKILKELEQDHIIKQDQTMTGFGYVFEHEIVRQAVYELIPFELKQQLHLKLVAWLEKEYGENLDSIYAFLAYHCEAAENFVKAGFYLGKVAENALHNGAYAEAEKNLTYGLQLLKKMPETQEGLIQSLELMVILGTLRFATMGQTAIPVKELFYEAQSISEKIQTDIPQKAMILFGLSAHLFFSGKLHETQKYANEALAFAERVDSEPTLMQAHLMLANSSFWLADFKKGSYHVEKIATLYNHDAYKHHLSHFAQNPIITASFGSILSKALQGYPDQALSEYEKILDLANSMNHAYSLALCLQFKGYLSVILQEVETTALVGQQLLEICQKEGFPMFFTMAESLLGWAIAQKGQLKEGTALIETALKKWKDLDALLGSSLYYLLLLEIYDFSEKWEEGLLMFDIMETDLQNWEGKVFITALLNLKGKFYFETNHYDKAEYWLKRSLKMSQNQENYHTALNVAINLATLYKTQNKPDTALHILESVFISEKRTPFDKKAIFLIHSLKKS